MRLNEQVLAPSIPTNSLWGVWIHSEPVWISGFGTRVPGFDFWFSGREASVIIDGLLRDFESLAELEVEQVVRFNGQVVTPVQFSTLNP